MNDNVSFAGPFARRLGCEIIGPFASSSKALHQLRHGPVLFIPLGR
jgi:hypothetical protein